jgi:hypothetical protein
VDTFAGAQAVVTAALDESHQQCASAYQPSGEVIAPSTDDRPFLYYKGEGFPSLYLWAIAGILAVSAIALRVLGGSFRSMRPYADLFFMGAAFLLLETKNVATFALLFGTTWLVNALVFAGVLVVVLAAVEPEPAEQAAPAQAAARAVRDDPRQPARERRRLAQRRQLGERGHERILHGVLGVGAPPEQEHREPHRIADMPPVQRLARPPIAGARALDQLRVARRHVERRDISGPTGTRSRAQVPGSHHSDHSTMMRRRPKRLTPRHEFSLRRRILGGGEGFALGSTLRD